MGSWESDIRKKALSARPFEPKANWERMEGMLEAKPAETKPLFWSSKQYWLIAAALLMLFGATTALSLWERENLSVLSPGEEISVVLPPSTAKTSTASPNASPAMMASATTEAIASSTQSKTDYSAIKTISPQETHYAFTALSVPPAPALVEAFGAASVNKTYQLTELPTPYPTAEMPSQDWQIAASTVPVPKGKRVVKDLRIGLYHLSESSRQYYVYDNTVYAHSVVETGTALGLMKRFRRVWEAGVRLEISDLFYYVSTSADAYSDMVGKELRAKGNIRRYLRPDVSKKIQPYMGFASGISRATMDLYNVEYVAAEPSPNASARKADNDPILPGGYVDYYQELESLPRYKIDVYQDASKYVRIDNSVQLGTDIRLRPRLSLNLEFGAKIASVIHRNVHFDEVMDNHSFQIQQNIGLQYAF